jgi:stringent starvation protein B
LEPKNKQQVVEEMLSKGDTMICIDTRYPDVRVPDNHKGQEDLRLVLNLNFRHEISTLPDGIQAELLFGGVPFLCWIPYESLWAVYNPQTGEGYLWPGETPVSLRDILGDKLGPIQKKADIKPPAAPASPKPSVRKDPASAPETPAKSTAKARPKLRVINGGKKD